MGYGLRDRRVNVSVILTVNECVLTRVCTVCAHCMAMKLYISHHYIFYKVYGGLPIFIT